MEKKDQLQRIRAAVEEKINPKLAEHFGGCQVSGVEDGTIYLQLTGDCAACGAARITLEDFIKPTLMELFPESKDVVLDNRLPPEVLAVMQNLSEKGKK